MTGTMIWTFLFGMVTGSYAGYLARICLDWYWEEQERYDRAIDALPANQDDDDCTVIHPNFWRHDEGA